MSGLGEMSNVVPPQLRACEGESRRLLDPSATFEESVALGERRRCARQWDVPPRLAVALVALMLVGAALASISSSSNASGKDIDRYPSMQALAGAHDERSNARGKGRAPADVSRRERSGRDGIAVEGDTNDSSGAPNVILILLDDVGMGDLGYASTDLVGMTPFIDSMAAGGVKLTRYYTNEICTPARASLMTGRDTFRMGMQYEELQAYAPWSLPLEEVTIAERFRAAGYATHMAGKWNLGNYVEETYPHNRGFDTFLGYMGAQETYRAHKWGSYKDFGYGDKDGYVDYSRNTTRMGPEFAGQYSTSVTGDRAIMVAKEHQEKVLSGNDQPLFLYLAFQAVHYPLEIPQDYLFTEEQHEAFEHVARLGYPRRVMFAKILAFVDITLQKVVRELDAIGMMDNTLVVLASDNGGCPAYGGSNYPFRGGKHTMFEGGVRAPALVYSKSEDIIPAMARGSVYDGMMHVTDWVQTLAHVTGIPTEGMGKRLSGFNHWLEIIGNRPEGSPAIRNELVISRNSYTYDSDADMMVLSSTPNGAFIKDGWKINVRDQCAGWFSFNRNDAVHAPECDVMTCATCTDACEPDTTQNLTFLFNIAEDPLETVNLISEMPEKFEEMVRLWDEACTDEAVPEYKATDERAFKFWKQYDKWVVAWL